MNNLKYKLYTCIFCRSFWFKPYNHPILICCFVKFLYSLRQYTHFYTSFNSLAFPHWSKRLFFGESVIRWRIALCVEMLFIRTDCTSVMVLCTYIKRRLDETKQHWGKHAPDCCYLRRQVEERIMKTTESP